MMVTVTSPHHEVAVVSPTGSSAYQGNLIRSGPNEDVTESLKQMKVMEDILNGHHLIFLFSQVRGKNKLF
jgi:hypothetical protein